MSVLIVMGFLAIGCNPAVVVRQNPGKHNRGIRYYRPKPYLLLTPATTKTQEPVATGIKTTYSDPIVSYVNIDMKYMPDFSEEYAITVRSGMGINNTQITLQDGWNLTQINQELDSQTDENLTAFADILKSVPSVGSPFAGTPQTPTPHAIRATNVPLGFYESIINRGPDGKKRLYGWRYVGFAPFNGAPLDASGAEMVSANDGSLDVYGLTFEYDGAPGTTDAQAVMVFKKLRTLRPEEFVEQGEIIGQETRVSKDRGLLNRLALKPSARMVNRQSASK